MGRLLKLALEGETVQVVDGMFVAVPLGAAAEQQETLAALEELDEALGGIDEACRAGDVQLFLTGQTPTEDAVATESVKDTVKTVLKKIWALIARVIAASQALMQGFIVWLRKGGTKRRRPLHKEVYKAYLDMSTLLEEIFGILKRDKVAMERAGKKMMKNIIDVDKLDEKFGAKLNNAQRDMLVDGPYMEAIKTLIGVVCEKDTSNYLRQIAEGVGQEYRELQQEAHKVDASHAEAPAGPGTHDQIVPYTRESLEKFSQQVDSAMGLTNARVEKVLGDLTHARQKAIEAKDASASAKLPDDVDKAIQIASNLGHSMPYELALRYRDEYLKMFEDVQKSLGEAEKRFTNPGALIDEKTVENGNLPAQTYLDRATLEAVRAFGKSIQDVAAGYAMIEDHFDAAVTLVEIVMDYVLEIFETFGADTMADIDPKFQDEVERIRRRKEDLLKRMNDVKTRAKNAKK
jgi:hypothetical protein